MNIKWNDFKESQKCTRGEKISSLQLCNVVRHPSTMQRISQNTAQRQNPRELVVHSQKCANSAPFLVLQSL